MKKWGRRIFLLLGTLSACVIAILLWNRDSNNITPTVDDTQQRGIPEAHRASTPSPEAILRTTMQLLAVVLAFGTIAPFFFEVTPIAQGLLNMAIVIALIANVWAFPELWLYYKDYNLSPRPRLTQMAIVLIYVTLVLLGITYMVLTYPELTRKLLDP